MKKGANYRSLSDCQISPADIPSQYAALTPNHAMMIRDEVSAGKYISVRNTNNLSEVLIYRRNDFHNTDSEVLRWDGTTINTDWYDPQKTIYLISNAEELAGLAKLVNEGINFTGKSIRLTANINLNSKEWTPIGGKVEYEAVNAAGDIYYKATNLENSFSGLFDGGGHTIYGLRMTNTDADNRFVGFFKSLNHAMISNLMFENALVESDETETFLSIVCGYSASTTFVNVIVSGRVRGEECSGISAISMDSSFYSCINRANLVCKINQPSSRLRAGGIVCQISLSDALISKIKDRDPMLFDKCIQNGTITIYAGHAGEVWAGQMYGCLAHNPNGDAHGIILNKCGATRDITVHDLDAHETKAVFFGKTDSSSYSSNFVDGIGHKVDLLNGLIGKTSTAINVKVIKVTGSTVIDNIVLPGSINILRSESFTNTFVTVDTNPISSEDGIANLEPYFVFVKTSKI